MSFIFRTHKTGVLEIKDWGKSGLLKKEDINSIPDTIHQGSAAKLGSSIPSPFARMYLFDTAFKMVNQSTSVGNTMYHQLVSDCLDMFRFLFLFADSPHVSFKIWDKEIQLKEMAQSSFEEHRKLSKAMELFFSSKKFRQVRQVVLVYYKGKLVGGTSPITALYTSPNWHRIIDDNGWNNDFKTSGSDILFEQTPYAIHQRDDDFIKYMYKFIYAHNNTLSKQSEAFFDYFVKIRNENRRIDNLLLHEKIEVGYTIEQFLQDYAPIRLNPSDDTSKDVLYSGACALLKPKKEDTIALIQKSDFVIANTVDYFKGQKDDNGVPLNIPKPLVLIKGNHKLNYVDSPWDDRTVVPDVPSIPLHKRKLPDNNFTYPYISTGDFLEDALIETAFNLNQETFFTGFKGNFSFLLPIKKEYFNYFTLQDLERQISILQNGDIVNIELKIPIAHQKFIELSRSYDLKNEDHIVKYKGIKGFNLGVFPFYQVIDKPDLNQYTIALVSNVTDIGLQFHRYTHLTDEAPVRVTEKVRTKLKALTTGSTYYSVQGEKFDFIEISIGGVVSTKGLVIPKFKEVQVKDAIKKFYFAVDFGTTNTYIAYAAANSQKIEEFTIDQKDRQMVLLSELKLGKKKLQDSIVDGFGKLASFVETFDREFIPSFIQEKSQFEYPLRSAICEHNSYVKGMPILFENINIGFYLELDPRVMSDGEYHYHTDLKWSMDNKRLGKEKERVEMYIRETLWLMKNKMLMNNGWGKPTVIWMIPLSMKKRIRNIFEDIWKTQVTEVFGSGEAIDLKMKYESIVPYYGLNRQNGVDIGRHQNVINIDIGGGTTDVFFFYKNDNQFYSTSFRFAGNDIWGEGTNESIKKDNGFVQIMERAIQMDKETFIANHPEALAVYQGFITNPELSSSDISSLLFKYDHIFKFSDHIRNHKPLSTILVIHLAATFFHVAQILKSKSLGLPQIVSFTGKGSEYIRLISSNNRDIQELVMAFLELFTEQQMPPRAQVVMTQKPKQLTAEGAIMHESSSERIDIDEKQVNLVHLGIENRHDQNPLDTRTVKDIDSLRPETESQFKSFMKQMKKPEISKLMRSLEIPFKFGDYDVLNELEELTNISYNEMTYRLKLDADTNEEIEESPFFWFFKDSLYKLSKELNNLKP